MSSLKNKIVDSLEQYKHNIYNEIANAIESELCNPIYKVECHNCGESLEYSQEYDKQGDLIVTVIPCDCKEGEL